MSRRRLRRKQILRRRRIMLLSTLAAAMLALIGIVTYAMSREGGSRQQESPQRQQPAAGQINIVRETEEPTEALTEAQTEQETETDTEGRPRFQDLHSMDWGADDAYLMAKLAMAEAEGESTEGKAMVIMVVLNRVFSEDFPGTIAEVINQQGQFSPVWEPDWKSVEPSADCWAALEMIENGWDGSEGALYFEATYNGTDTWHSRNLEYIKTVGGHNFYK